MKSTIELLNLAQQKLSSLYVPSPLDFPDGDDYDRTAYGEAVAVYLEKERALKALIADCQSKIDIDYAMQLLKE